MADEMQVNYADLISRMKAGDQVAREQLFSAAFSQLEKIARKKLNQEFGRFRAHGMETGDLLDEALMRFLERLKKEDGLANINTEKDFFVLAAHYIRWTLLNTAKGLRKHLARLPEGDFFPSQTVHPYSLDEMAALHQQVEKLPAELREVFGLYYYLELTYDEIAGKLGVSRDTVKRRYKEAKEMLQGALRPA